MSEKSVDHKLQYVEVANPSITRASFEQMNMPHEGNIIRLGTFLGYKFAIIRGFYFASPILILGLIAAVNLTYLYFFSAVMNVWIRVSIYFAALGMFMCVFLCWTLDPGYIVRTPHIEEDIEMGKQVPAAFTCRKCFTTREDEAVHDGFCDLCVIGYDHFCIVLGNVIGHNNIRYFYSIFFFYVVNILLLVLGIIYNESNNLSRPPQPQA